jgi:hypothetical protein
MAAFLKVLVFTIIVYLELRPMVKMMLGGLHYGQFDGTKLTNATRAEDPVSFWGDCAWILMWLTLFFFGWIYICIEVLFSA